MWTYVNVCMLVKLVCRDGDCWVATPTEMGWTTVHLCMKRVNAVLCVGLGGSGHHAGRVQQRSAGLQRPTQDQQVLLAKDPQDLLQEEQLLHQDPAWRGETPQKKKAQPLSDGTT